MPEPIEYRVNIANKANTWGGLQDVSNGLTLVDADFTGAANDAARDTLAGGGNIGLDTGGSKLWMRKTNGAWVSVGLA